MKDYLEKLNEAPEEVQEIFVQFQDKEEQDRFWEEWWQAPEAQTYLESLVKLQDAGGSREIWLLE